MRLDRVVVPTVLRTGPALYCGEKAEEIPAWQNKTLQEIRGCVLESDTRSDMAIKVPILTIVLFCVIAIMIFHGELLFNMRDAFDICRFLCFNQFITISK